MVSLVSRSADYALAYGTISQVNRSVSSDMVISLTMSDPSSKSA